MSKTSHTWVLKFAIAISVVLAPVALFAADSVDLVVRAIDVGQNPTANVLYTLTPTGPLRRTYGTNLVTVAQRSLRSDANGVAVFTNTLWGNWDLDIPGSSPTSFRLWITTNYSGRQSAALYVTNSSSMPPNPTASYYTQGQVDALIAEKGGGSGATNAVNTVQTNGTPVVTAATVINFVAGTNATVDVSGNGSTATVTIGSTAVGTGGIPVTAGAGLTGVTNNGVLQLSLYSAPAITSFDNNQNTVEVGATIASTVLTWTLVGGAITSQSLDNSIGSLNTALRTYTHTSSYSTDRTYVLTASDGVTPTTRSTTINFLRKAYWGASANTSLNDAQVIALSQAFATGRQMTQSISATGQYLYIAYPATFGAASFVVDGFADAGWTLVTRTFVNASGGSASYNIYRHTLIFSGGTYSVTVN